MEFMRGVEVQDGKRGGSARGALHDHAMVWSPVPLDKAWIRRQAMNAGFGHSVDLALCDPNSRKAAYYVSKYVTKAADQRGMVPWAADVVDQQTGEVSRRVVEGRYRTWTASKQWGKTMAQIKAEGRVHAAAPRPVWPITADSGSDQASGQPMDAKSDPP